MLPGSGAMDILDVPGFPRTPHTIQQRRLRRGDESAARIEQARIGAYCIQSGRRLIAKRAPFGSGRRRAPQRQRFEQRERTRPSGRTQLRNPCPLRRRRHKDHAGPFDLLRSELACSVPLSELGPTRIRRDRLRPYYAHRARGRQCDPPAGDSRPRQRRIGSGLSKRELHQRRSADVRCAHEKKLRVQERLLSCAAKIAVVGHTTF